MRTFNFNNLGRPAMIVNHNGVASYPPGRGMLPNYHHTSTVAYIGGLLQSHLYMTWETTVKSI